MHRSHTSIFNFDFKIKQRKQLLFFTGEKIERCLPCIGIYDDDCMLPRSAEGANLTFIFKFHLIKCFFISLPSKKLTVLPTCTHINFAALHIFHLGFKLKTLI